MEARLIKKVRENEVLYNPQSTHYRDTEVRQKTWEKIGKELNIKAEEAKFAWDKVRRCFINARNRRRAKEVECGIIIHPWKHEKAMSFLWPFIIRNRKTRSEFQKSDYNGSCENGDSDHDIYGDEQKLESNQAVDNGDDVKTEREDVQEYNSPTTLIDDDTTMHAGMGMDGSVTNKRDYSFDDDVSERMDSKRRCTAQQNSILDMDECDMFFMSMSKMTKSLPILERSKVKLAVSNSVLQAMIAAHGSASTPN